jgi:uncharacterized protein YutE (UPF0331/DUF86 family)
MEFLGTKPTKPEGRESLEKNKILLETLTPKFDSIARCILRIESKQPFTEDQLCENFDLQDIISTNITRSIQLCVDVSSIIVSRSQFPIPSEMAGLFDILCTLNFISKNTALSLKKSVGLRNIMVHEYEKINWEIVFNVSNNHLKDLKEFCRQILAKLNL